MSSESNVLDDDEKTPALLHLYSLLVVLHIVLAASKAEMGGSKNSQKNVVDNLKYT